MQYCTDCAIIIIGMQHAIIIIANFFISLFFYN